MSFCNKKNYSSRKIAKKARRESSKYLQKRFTEYYCEKCQAFHLTTMDPARSRKMNRKLTT